MEWQFTTCALAMMASSALAAVVAWFSWQRVPAPGARSLTVLNLAVSVWSLGYALSLSSADLGSKVLWAKVQYVGIVLVPVMFLVFALRYTDRGRAIAGRRWLPLAIMPLATLLLAWTNDSHHLIWGDLGLRTVDTFSVLQLEYGAFFWIWVAFAYMALLVGAGLLLDAVIRSPGLYRSQAGALLVATLTPWAANITRITNLDPIPHLDLTNIAFAVTGIALLAALRRFRLLDIVPVARDALLQSLADGLVVIDKRDRVIDLNPAASRFLGCPIQEVVGRPSADVLPSQIASNLADGELGDEHHLITLGSGDDQRHLELRISPITDRRDRFTGQLLFLHDITEQVQAAAALRESEARLKQITDSIDDVVWITDWEDQSILFVNPAYEKVWGRSVSGLLENSRSWAEAIHPDDRDQAWNAFLELDEEKQYDQEYRILHPDGSLRWIRDRGFPIRDEEGRVQRVAGIAQDITDRKQAADALGRRAAELEALHATLQDITMTQDLPALLQTIVERAARLLDAPGGGLYLCNPDRQSVRCEVSYNTPTSYVGTELSYGEGAAGVVAQTGESLIIDDYRVWPGRAATYEADQPFAAVLSVPMKWLGHVIGVIHVLRTMPFSPADLGLLILFANQAAIGVGTARLLRDTRQQVAGLETLRRTSLELTSSLDLSRVLGQIVESALSLVSATDCHIYLYDQETGTFSFGTALWENGRREPAVKAVRSDGLTASVARQRQAIVINDAPSHPLYASPAAAAWNVQAVAGFPLLSAERVVGVFTIAFVKPHIFDEHELRVLGLLADQAAIAIENARLVEGLEQEVANRTAEILAEQEKTEAILRSAGDAITMADLGMRIQFVNEAFETMTGYTAQEVLGRPVDMMSLNGSPQQLGRFMDRVVERGQVWRREVTSRRKDGRLYDVLLTIAPMLDPEGQLVGFVSSHRDISQQKDLERARSQFMTNVSHQLRTPVTNIRLYADILQRDLPPEQLERYTTILGDQSDRLSHLIEDILEITALDAGQGVRRWEPVSLPSLIKDTLVRFQTRAQEAGLSLSTEPLPADLPVVNGDQIRLGQALGELVENAVTFAALGDKASDKRVTLRVTNTESSGEQWVTLEVRDTGPGVPAAEQGQVFARFFRGALSESGHVPGTGLGLSIAEEIVQAHGGRITVQSEPGAGSTFTIWLRAAPDQAGSHG